MSVDYYDYMQSAEWRERANAAKRRVGHRCQVCNRPATAVTLVVHHRTYERLGQERAEDLTVLCRDCHALYEKNKRIPRLPLPQPLQPAIKEDPIINAQPQAPILPPAKPTMLFAPAKSANPQATLPPPKAAPILPLETDSVYRLLPETPTAESVQPQKQAPSARERTAHATRDSRIRIMAILIILAMLSAVSLLDNDSPRSTPTAEDRPVRMGTVQPTPTRTVAIQPVVPATPAAAVMPPRATAQPTALPATRTVTATVAATPSLTGTLQGIVNQTTLVCGNPCSCSPVVRTIPGGTQVSVEGTQSCGLDTWYRIGEDEWLGPRFVDEGPTE